MATARVELVGSQSHTSRGRAFKKGQPHVITNAADIKYYQAQPEFNVVVLDDEAPPKTKAKALPISANAVAPTAGDEDGHHHNDEHDEEVGAPAGAKPAKPSKAAEADDEDKKHKHKHHNK